MGGKTDQLKGESGKNLLVLSPSKLRKAGEGRGAVLQLCSMYAFGLTTSNLWGPQSEKLLQKYEDLFVEPKELPPARAQDHKITLVEGTGPI